MSDEYLSWLAGFFEGEGSCGYYEGKSNPKRRITASLYQKEREVLDEIRDKFGFGCISMHRECHSWFVQGKNARIFLSSILPWVRSTRKRNQIHKALLSWADRPKRTEREKEEVREIKRKYAGVRERNKQGQFT